MADPVALLQDLIRFDTVNPPGNERVAQEHLAGLLEGAGLEVELLGRTHERPNLVARLRGTGDGPTLCLLSHVDTVLANPAEWSHDPWAADIVDGVLYGRGAQDMKQQTATEVCAALRLAAAGWRGAGDLLVVCVVDEETGGAEGAQWLCGEHPDKVRSDYVLNEGAGTLVPFGDERLYPICIAEKGVFRFTLRTDGVAGHASMPAMGDNALLKLAPLLERMAARQPEHDVTEGPRLLLEALGLTFEQLRERDPRLAVVVEPMLGVTLAPTIARASTKINVIPSVAELEVDCRVPPGLGAQEAERRIHEVLGGEGYRLEFTEQVVGNGSPAEGAADGRDRPLDRGRGPGRAAGPHDPAGLHRLADLARRVPRLRRLRLLPAARDDALRGRAAVARRRRAHRRARPRLRHPLLRGHGP